jgi:hypothetical protein
MYELLRTNKRLWELFTKKGEYGSNALDDFDRFPLSSSKSQNYAEPEVSRFLFENGYRSRYPDGKKFALCLTHDIDQLTSSFLTGLLHRLRSPKYIEKTAHKVMSKVIPLKNFSEMMNLEEQYGGKSSFYFLALPEESENSTYDIEEISNEMKEITERGWEVGLHGSLEAYNDLSLMTREKEKIERALGKKVIGYRNHFLRFKIPTTWELIRLAGFKYDTTFGYNCKVGFRNGMCHPFFPFNLETNRPIDILEIPMAAQDAFYGSIIGFDLNGAWETMKALIDETERYNGVITVLWHNTRMTGDSLRLYKKVLSYSLSKNAWIASAEEIYRWWVDSGFKTKYSEH